MSDINIKLNLGDPAESVRGIAIEAKDKVNSLEQQVATVQDSESDFGVSDENGNMVLSVSDGHVKTKNFDSAGIQVTTQDSESDLEVTDEQGNSILRLKDGHIQTRNFNSQGSTTPTVASKKRITYTGEPVKLPYLCYEEFGQVPRTVVQSFCFMDDYMVLVYGNGYCQILNRNTLSAVTEEILLPHTNTTQVHGNISSIGQPSDSTDKLLYTTHWNNDKGVVAYRYNTTSGAIEQKQVILPSSTLKASQKFGLGNTDFIVDGDYLYSICYKENTWSEVETNKTCICKFALPKLSAGSKVELDESDIIDSFEVENIPTRQDACIKNGILYVLNGYDNPHYAPTLRAINLSTKQVQTRISLSSINNSETEGIDIVDDYMVIGFTNTKTLYKLTF